MAVVFGRPVKLHKKLWKTAEKLTQNTKTCSVSEFADAKFILFVTIKLK